MILILIGGLVLLAAAVTLILRGAVQTSSPDAIQQIGAYGFSGHPVEVESEGSTARRSLDGLADSLGGFASRRLGALQGAGAAEAPDRGRHVLDDAEEARRLPAACSRAPSRSSGSGSARLVAAKPVFIVGGAIVLAIFGWLGPRHTSTARARMRLEQIDYELPELIDILVVTVEAGVGFTASLRVAAGKMRGPLGQELRLTLQEQNMGLSSTDALLNMLERADTPGMRSFVRSIVQGETLGVSIGQIMRNLAIEMRKQRRATAEERAQKAPVKMLFPLIFLIFPAMFIVLLLPALIKVTEELGGS